jgi:hypothetical protein
MRQPVEGKFINFKALKFLLAAASVVAYCQVNCGDADTQSKPGAKYDPGPFEREYKHHQKSVALPICRLLPPYLDLNARVHQRVRLRRLFPWVSLANGIGADRMGCRRRTDDDWLRRTDGGYA